MALEGTEATDGGDGTAFPQSDIQGGAWSGTCTPCSCAFACLGGLHYGYAAENRPTYPPRIKTGNKEKMGGRGKEKMNKGRRKKGRNKEKVSMPIFTTANEDTAPASGGAWTPSTATTRDRPPRGPWNPAP